MDDLLPELKIFIETFIVTNNIKNVDLSNLNLNTSLDLDLNLFDLEIDMFLTDFVEMFKIDYSKFNWKNYGYPDGNFLVLFVRSFFNYKLKWVKQLAHFLYKPKISIDVLQQAIRTGILV
jgi:hypothetical protein